MKQMRQAKRTHAGTATTGQTWHGQSSHEHFSAYFGNSCPLCTGEHHHRGHLNGVQAHELRQVVIFWLRLLRRQRLQERRLRVSTADRSQDAEGVMNQADMCLGMLCEFGTGTKSSAAPMLTCLATTNPYSKPTRCPFGGAGALAAASENYAQFATAPPMMQLHSLLMGTSSFPYRLCSGAAILRWLPSLPSSNEHTQRFGKCSAAPASRAAPYQPPATRCRPWEARACRTKRRSKRRTPWALPGRQPPAARPARPTRPCRPRPAPGTRPGRSWAFRHPTARRRDRRV